MYGSYETHAKSPRPQEMQDRLQDGNQHGTSRTTSDNEEVIIAKCARGAEGSGFVITFCRVG